MNHLHEMSSNGWDTQTRSPAIVADLPPGIPRASGAGWKDGTRRDWYHPHRGKTRNRRLLEAECAYEGL